MNTARGYKIKSGRHDPLNGIIIEPRDREFYNFEFMSLLEYLIGM